MESQSYSDQDRAIVAAHIKDFDNPQNFEPVIKAGFYDNIDPNVSVRPPGGRGSYEYFRPGEVIPRGNSADDLRKIMILCNQAYQTCSIVRSVVDMLSEFVAEGIEIIHPDKGPNNFYHAWARKVHLEDRTERFASWLAKSGQTVVRRKFGKIDRLLVNRMRDTAAEGDVNIPLGYVFYDPATIDLVGGHIGAMSDKKIYGIRIPLSNFRNYTVPDDIFNGLPKELRDAIEGKTVTTDGRFVVIPIPEDRVYVAYYKKDDCDIWAKSFIYPVLSDIAVNDKLKLAKTAMLDGCANRTSIWKLGDHKEKIYPSPAQANRLNQILKQNPNGGSIDLIWNSMITYEEHYPPIERLANFVENDAVILRGLGIPESLFGGIGGKGQVNSTAGLKNFLKKIEYIRRVITDWLNAEIDIIQEQMGFRHRPIIRFAHDDLGDERTYYDFLIQLVDRDIISDQSILEEAKRNIDIEKVRLSDEYKDRKKDELPPKASPFHNPQVEDQQDFELKKMAKDHSFQMTQQMNTPTQTSKGRPNGAKDKVVRKRKVTAKLVLHANELYTNIEKYVVEKALARYGVSDIRSLSSEQKTIVEQTIMTFFSGFEPFKDLTDEYIRESYQSNNDAKELFNENYYRLVGEAEIENLTVGQKKALRINAYIETWGIKE